MGNSLRSFSSRNNSITGKAKFSSFPFIHFDQATFLKFHSKYDATIGKTNHSCLHHLVIYHACLPDHLHTYNSLVDILGGSNRLGKNTKMTLNILLAANNLYIVIKLMVIYTCFQSYRMLIPLHWPFLTSYCTLI